MVEVTAEQAIAKIRSNEAQVNQLNNQIRTVVQTLEALGATRITLDQMPDAETEGLAPIGGVFLPIKANATTIKVDVGAGVVVDKTRMEAVEMLKKREELLQKDIERLQALGRVINTESNEIKKKLMEAQQAQQPDVPVISG
ncbi:hypothetical protein ACFLQ2_01655 [archaeon]